MLLRQNGKYNGTADPMDSAIPIYILLVAGIGMIAILAIFCVKDESDF